MTTKPPTQPRTPEAEALAETIGAEVVPPGGETEESRTYLESIAHNYAQYVAVDKIYWGNALAFNPGDPVPADRGDLQQLIADGQVEAVKPAKK